MIRTIVRWLFLLFTLLALPVGARIACWPPANAHNTRIEKLICEADTSDSIYLVSRDEDLNRFYPTVLAYRHDGMTLKRAQLKWLREVRDACTDAACLRVAYDRRLLELEAMLQTAVVPSGKPLAERDVPGVCGEILRLADSGRLARRALPGLPVQVLGMSAVSNLRHAGGDPHAVDWQLEQKNIYTGIIRTRLSPGAPYAEFSAAWTGGTCHSSQMLNLTDEDLAVPAIAGDKGFVPVEDPEDVMRWAWWGGYDYLVHLDGRHYIITHDQGNLNMVHLISWVRPDGLRQPLCSADVQTRLTAGRAEPDGESAGICERIVHGQTKNPQWQALGTDGRDKIVALLGEPVDFAFTAQVPEAARRPALAFIKLVYESGAGCGAHFETLKQTGAAKDTPLARALDALMLDPQEHDKRETAELHTLADKLYLQTSHHAYGGEVYRVADGQLTPVCALNIATASRIKHVWRQIKPDVKPTAP